MQALYAAENGELSWSWEAVFIALAFRGGAKVAEYFPNLTARWKGLPKEKQENLINEVAAKESTSAEIAMERLKWLQENKPQGNPPEGAPNGKEQPLALEYKPFPEKLPDHERFTVSVQPNEAFKFPEAGRN